MIRRVNEFEWKNTYRLRSSSLLWLRCRLGLGRSLCFGSSLGFSRCLRLGLSSGLGLRSSSLLGSCLLYGGLLLRLGLCGSRLLLSRGLLRKLGTATASCWKELEG